MHSPPGVSRKRSVNRLACAALGSIALSGVIASAHAEQIVGLTDNNRLITFDSSTPQSLIYNTNISGLGGNESLLGIDFRPTTGVLYGLGSANNLYTLNYITGAASLVAPLTPNPADATNPFVTLLGANFGVDFNPVPDLAGNPSFRVVSDADQNLRINVNVGPAGQVNTDTNLNPGDPNLSGVAYINNDRNPATGTMLFGIDFLTDRLVNISNPNGGVIVDVGPLNALTSPLVGFDVSSQANVWASLTGETSNLSSLYRVDTGSGNAMLIGAIGNGETLRDISALVPEPDMLWLVGMAGVGAMLFGIGGRRNAGASELAAA